MFEETSKPKMDPGEDFHCFCEELLLRMIGRFPDTGVLLKVWRCQPDDVKGVFQKKKRNKRGIGRRCFLTGKSVRS